MIHARFLPSLLAAAVFVCAGCGATEKEQKDADFHTSGNREADQRAEETVAKTQQLRGEGMNQTDTHRTLYSRLGGDAGLKSIVSDWIDRAIADPRVNWKRVGVKSGGLLGVGDKDMTWQPTQARIDEMKKHIVQMLALASGGPAHYDGRDMKNSHAGMKISNTEFDAAVGDLQAAMEAHKVQTQEIKELLAIVESTREQIVEER
ncbi:MAG TPA: group 1 truncated hemoglobin [Tepidisphaeraceae bacterium]|jgi:hemoglobin